MLASASSSFGSFGSFPIPFWLAKNAVSSCESDREVGGGHVGMTYRPREGHRSRRVSRGRGDVQYLVELVQLLVRGYLEEEPLLLVDHLEAERGVHPPDLVTVIDGRK